jgi:hypothetical protein
MLINISNHPYTYWDETQKEAAKQYGKCIDLPFPSVDPRAGEDYIDQLSTEYVNQVIKYQSKCNESVVVHLMGEMTFVYSLLEKLKQHRIQSIASTTERVSQYSENGVKETIFSFVRFRNYFTTNP